MNPGRELDALVAEKVMGFGKSDWEGMVYDAEQGGYFPLPKYSTDIAAAWEVLEKLGEDYAVQNRGDHWIVMTGYHDWIAARSSTAPHAICLAALKAVGAI